MLFFYHGYAAGFNFPQRSQLRQGKSCEWELSASWFSIRKWLHHDETYKISSASRAKVVPKCIKIVSMDVSGEIPRTPLTRGGVPPLVLSPNSCLRHSSNVFGISWPDHFSKADDGPVETDFLVYQVMLEMFHTVHRHCDL